MSLGGKRVLVTGAGGFIGSHLSEALVGAGAQVRAFVHYRGDGSHGWLDQSKSSAEMEFVAGDVCDRDSVHAAMKDVEVVFHLAALIGIPYSYHAPASYLRTNIEGTLHVLQAARDCGVKRVIQTSTSEVYGSAVSVPMREDHPLQGQSPYSASKIGADKFAEAFHRSFGLPVVTLRPFNTFGPRQSLRAVIPTIIAQCLTGDTVRLGNLKSTRDLNYVSNTVDAFLLAASAEAAPGKTVHVGSGNEISIGDLAARIGKLLGREIRVAPQSERLRPADSEVDRLVADSALAKTLLGWQPNVTLDEGLARTADWIRQNLHQYRTSEYSI